MPKFNKQSDDAIIKKEQKTKEAKKEQDEQNQTIPEKPKQKQEQVKHQKQHQEYCPKPKNEQHPNQNHASTTYDTETKKEHHQKHPKKH